MRQAWNVPSGMTIAKFSTLVSVDRLGPVPISRLAEVEQVQPPTMTSFVNSLAAGGLLVRTKSATDRRLVQVRLTRAGKKAVEEARYQSDVFLVQRIAQLSDEEVATIVRALPALERLIEDA
jgi:DNA-binding MarR family transcriptional regulator